MRGITVTLYDKAQTGTDPFGAPVYTETPVEVDNVLVAPVSAEELLDIVNLYEKKATYQLGIPKGDTHNWQDRRVDFFGQSWRTFGFPTEGIEELIPLDWNKKVMVEQFG